LLPNPLMSNQDQQLNVAYQQQRNDPYAPMYNSGSRYHPNFSWNQGAYQGGLSASAAQASCSQFSRHNVGQYQNQHAYVNPHSAPTFANPPIPPPEFGNEQEKKLNILEKTFNNFMQTTTQMLNTNHQAITRLELQVSQMATQVGEMEKRTFPSQPVANPKDVRSTPFNRAQVNVIHTLRSRKEVDNQVVMPD